MAELVEGVNGVDDPNADATAVGARGTRHQPYWVAIVVLGLVGGVVPVVLAWHFGALGIPRNDDWAYLLSAFQFADGGTLNGHGWAVTNLVGQLVLSLPNVWLFGHRITALQVQTATLGVVGLVAVFDLAKQLLSPRRAMFVALIVAVGPMWSSLSASFMTDVPAFAFAMICLALGGRAIRPHRVRAGLLVLAVLAGFVAFTIREYGIVAPISVCLTALWTARQWPRRQLISMIVGTVALVAAAAVFLAWRRTLPGWPRYDFNVPSPTNGASLLRKFSQTALLLGLLVSPAVLLAGPKRLVRSAWARAPRTSAAVGFLMIVGLGSAVVHQRSSGKWLGPGSYVWPNGTAGNSVLSGARPDLLPRWLLACLALAGVLAVTVVVLAAVPPTIDAMSRLRERRLGTPTPPALAAVILATIGYGLACAAPTLFTQPNGAVQIFDRYSLPLVPLVAVLVLHAGAGTTTRRTRIVSATALLALAAFGLVYAANSASFDGTRWRVATKAAELAGSPMQVDGGFEWNDYHAGHNVFFGVRPEARGHFCITLEAGAHPGTHGTLPAGRVWGPTGTQVWIVTRQGQPC